MTDAISAAVPSSLLAGRSTTGYSPRGDAAQFGQLVQDAMSMGHAAPAPDHQKIAKAAKQFEALMIGQVLKAAHQDEDTGWLGTGEDDDTASTAIQMAEEYLGQAIAQGGGLGIAKLVVSHLDANAATGSSSEPTTPAPIPTQKGSAAEAK